jgi:hypothetical protein
MGFKQESRRLPQLLHRPGEAEVIAPQNSEKDPKRGKNSRKTGTP